MNAPNVNITLKLSGISWYQQKTNDRYESLK